MNALSAGNIADIYWSWHFVIPQKIIAGTDKGTKNDITYKFKSIATSLLMNNFL